MEQSKNQLKKTNFRNVIKHIGAFLISAPFLAAVVSIGILTAALIIEPVIGMADNGDFYRSITSCGLYKLDRNESDQFFSYASTLFGKFKYFNEYSTGFSSSQGLFIKFAVFLDSIFTADADRFDIRFLGAVMIAFYSFTQYMLVDSLTYKAPVFAKYIIAAISVYFFTDIGYTAYFNSFYAEGIVLCSFLLSMTAIIMLIEKRHSPVFTVIIFILSSLLLITSKQQNAPLGAVLALMIVLIPVFRRKSDGIADSSRTTRLLNRLSIPLALVLCFSGIVVYLMISQVYVHTNAYHAMTRGILLTSTDPEKTLEEFNINPQYSLLNGTTFYDDTPVIDVESDLMVDNFYNRYGFVSISAYYITHPGSFIQMLNLAIKNAWKLRPAMDGNFDRSAGFAPGTQSDFFSLHSSILLNYIPRSFGFVIIWLIACLLVNRKFHGRLLAIAGSFLMGFMQILVSIIGAGDADIGKHIFLFDVVYDYVTLMTVAEIVIWIVKSISGSHSDKKKKTSKNLPKPFFKKKVSDTVIEKEAFIKAFAALSVLIIVCGVAAPDRVSAEEYRPENASDSSSDILLVCRNDDMEISVNCLINAFGKSAYEVTYGSYSGIPDKTKYVITTEQSVADDANAVGIKPFCIGQHFSSDKFIELTSVSNVSVTSEFGGYSQYSGFFSSIPLITSASGSKDNSLGSFKTYGGVNYPFCVVNSNGWYASWYQDNDLSAIMMSNALKKYTRTSQNGQMYVLLDEVYPFSSFDKLKTAGEELYKNGIPFIIRIMPVYTNLDYPSIQRYTQFLRYMQSLNGTIVIHDSIIQNSDYDPDALEKNITTFKKVLSDQGVYYYPMENSPLIINCEFIKKVKTADKNFGYFPVSTMISLDYSDEEIFQEEVASINSSYLSIDDYLLQYSNVHHSYAEGTVNDNYSYTTEEEKAFAGLMTYGNKVLMLIIIISLLVYSVIIFFGIKLYNNKFRKRR